MKFCTTGIGYRLNLNKQLSTYLILMGCPYNYDAVCTSNNNGTKHLHFSQRQWVPISQLDSNIASDNWDSQANAIFILRRTSLVHTTHSLTKVVEKFDIKICQSILTTVHTVVNVDVEYF